MTGRKRGGKSLPRLADQRSKLVDLSLTSGGEENSTFSTKMPESSASKDLSYVSNKGSYQRELSKEM